MAFSLFNSKPPSSIILLLLLVASLCLNSNGVSPFDASTRRLNRLNVVPSCGELVLQSQCSQNSKCSWCTSKDLDDMCFTKSEALRLPHQVFSCRLIRNKDGASKTREEDDESGNSPYFVLLQKMVAEAVGTYFLIFAGCASVVVDKNNDHVVTLPGISIVWGLAVLVIAYSIGHISGAHLNPAVTIAFASVRRFPLIQVPGYIAAQLLGAILGSGTLRLLFTGTHDQFSGTLPAGSNGQAFAIEFIITFLLMFVISGVATDSRAVGNLAGIAIGSTILLNVMISAPITGASMNPARSLGPSLVHHEYRGIWIYLVSPILGAVAGAWVYNFIRERPLQEFTKKRSMV